MLPLDDKPLVDYLVGMVMTCEPPLKPALISDHLQEVCQLVRLVAVIKGLGDAGSASVEKPFALALDRDPDVKMFFKIPSRFKVETPIGTYNPDWAVYLTRNGEEKLYFILETKGDTSLMELRTREQLKIHCGKKHFEALEDGVEMQAVKSWDEFRKQM